MVSDGVVKRSLEHFFPPSQILLLGFDLQHLKFLGLEVTECELAPGVVLYRSAHGNVTILAGRLNHDSLHDPAVLETVIKSIKRFHAIIYLVDCDKRDDDIDDAHFELEKLRKHMYDETPIAFLLDRSRTNRMPESRVFQIIPFLQEYTTRVFRVSTENELTMVKALDFVADTVTENLHRYEMARRIAKRAMWKEERQKLRNKHRELVKKYKEAKARKDEYDNYGHYDIDDVPSPGKTPTDSEPDC